MVAPLQHVALTRISVHVPCRCHGASHRPAVLRVKGGAPRGAGRATKGFLLNSRIHARMSNSVNPVKRAAAGLTRGHSRISVFAASTAAAGVLGAAVFAVGSAPWSQAAGDAAKTVQSGSQSATGHPAAAVDARLDALRSAATDGS